MNVLWFVCRSTAGAMGGRFTLLAAGLLFAALALMLALFPPAAAATVPAGFKDEAVADVPAPTALAFTPDGRMLVVSRPGKVMVYENGAVLQKPALDVTPKVCSNSERGLLGVAVDPDYATNRYVYVYYTFKKYGVCDQGTAKAPVNRVSRFTLSGANVASGERVLVDNIPSPNGNHNAGDLHFGKDGYLYVSVGDGGGSRGALARDKSTVSGKILRITRDGGIPATNPYLGTGSARCNTSGSTAAGRKCQEIFASGLRNPFRMAFDPNAAGTKFFINDVGQGTWEEIDRGKSGADYGWNVREGDCATGSTTNCGPPPPGMTNPIHDYNHSTGCNSITGGAFVPDGTWPGAFDGSYLYGDYVCGKIFKLTPEGDGYRSAPFITNLGAGTPISMTFSPSGNTQALYYTSYNSGGQVRRVSYTAAANRPPTAAISADKTYGPAPLSVNFDGGGSRDPDAGDTLTYLWDFGDGTTATTDTPETAHTYASSGSEAYTASLRARDRRGAVSAPATLRIDAGNTPPEPQISAPTLDFRFRVGERVSLSGTATDNEDGSLPAGSLRWEVLRHHNGSHTHPYASGTGADLSFQAPAPEDLDSTGTGNNLEVRLTATDSRGLSCTVTRRLEPRRVEVVLDTRPTGLEMRVNGSLVTSGKPLTSWEGYALDVTSPKETKGPDSWLGFSSWSDGGAAAHRVVTLADPATYTAAYEPLPAKATSLSLSRSRGLVGYNARVTLVGRLSDSAGPLAGEPVTVWRSTNAGRSWTKNGTASYDRSSRTYKAARRLPANAAFQMRFAGDRYYRKVFSRSVSVRARAYLSRPVAPNVVRKDRAFVTYGYLKPYHAGKTRLDLYHYRGGKWRFQKSVYAANRWHAGKARYTVRYRLPYRGRWYVAAYHADGSHAATRSPREYIRVR